MDSGVINVQTLYQDINENEMFKDFSTNFTSLLNQVYEIVDLPITNNHLECLFLAHIHIQYGNRMEVLEICNNLKQYIINFIFVITINSGLTANTKRLFLKRKELIKLALSVMEKSKMYVESVRFSQASINKTNTKH